MYKTCYVFHLQHGYQTGAYIVCVFLCYITILHECTIYATNTAIRAAIA